MVRDSSTAQIWNRSTIAVWKTYTVSTVSISLGDVFVGIWPPSNSQFWELWLKLYLFRWSLLYQVPFKIESRLSDLTIRSRTSPQFSVHVTLRTNEYVCSVHFFESILCFHCYLSAISVWWPPLCEVIILLSHCLYGCSLPINVRVNHADHHFIHF